MPTETETEKLIKAISKIRYDEYRPWRYLFFTFLNAVVRGVGQVLGMTLVLAAIIIIVMKVLSQFVDLPLIGNYISTIMNFIQSYMTGIPKQ